MMPTRFFSLLVLAAFAVTTFGVSALDLAAAAKRTVAKKKPAARGGIKKKPATGPGSERWKNKVRKDGKAYAKPGPKTDPKAPHNKKIRAVIRAEKRKGLEHIGGGTKTEITIQTPGGNRPYRRADASFRDPKTGEVFHHNVGLKTKKGRPIARERKALDDVHGAGEKMEFHEYKKK